MAARGGDGVQGGLRALVKGTGRGLRRDKDPGDLAGDLGQPLRSREGRGEEALTGGAARSVVGRRARCGRTRRQVGSGAQRDGASVLRARGAGLADGGGRLSHWVGRGSVGRVGWVSGPVRGESWAGVGREVGCGLG